MEIRLDGKSAIITGGKDTTTGEWFAVRATGLTKPTPLEDVRIVGADAR